MNADKLDHNLVGVLFPGIVKNDEKAIQCLGGIKQISEVCNNTFLLLLKLITFNLNFRSLKPLFDEGAKVYFIF